MELHLRSMYGVRSTSKYIHSCCRLLLCVAKNYRLIPMWLLEADPQSQCLSKAIEANLFSLRGSNCLTILLHVVQTSNTPDLVLQTWTSFYYSHDRLNSIIPYKNTGMYSEYGVRSTVIPTGLRQSTPPYSVAAVELIRHATSISATRSTYGVVCTEQKTMTERYHVFLHPCVLPLND